MMRILVCEIWKKFFKWHGKPEEFYKFYQEKNLYWKPDFSNSVYKTRGFSIDESVDFGCDETEKKAGVDMYKIPRLFELCDYFLGLTRYEYSETFRTRCCQLIDPSGDPSKNIPVFHIAMSLESMGRKLREEILPVVGKKFFKKRYPRFFDPEISKKDDEQKFISTAEQKIAFLFQKEIPRKEKKGKWSTFDAFKKATRVVVRPEPKPEYYKPLKKIELA